MSVLIVTEDLEIIAKYSSEIKSCLGVVYPKFSCKIISLSKYAKSHNITCDKVLFLISNKASSLQTVNREWIGNLPGIQTNSSSYKIIIYHAVSGHASNHLSIRTNDLNSVINTSISTDNVFDWWPSVIVFLFGKTRMGPWMRGATEHNKCSYCLHFVTDEDIREEQDEIVDNGETGNKGKVKQSSNIDISETDIDRLKDIEQSGKINASEKDGNSSNDKQPSDNKETSETAGDMPKDKKQNKKKARARKNVKSEQMNLFTYNILKMLKTFGAYRVKHYQGAQCCIIVCANSSKSLPPKLKTQLALSGGKNATIAVAQAGTRFSDDILKYTTKQYTKGTTIPLITSLLVQLSLVNARLGRWSTSGCNLNWSPCLLYLLAHLVFLANIPALVVQLGAAMIAPWPLFIYFSRASPNKKSRYITIGLSCSSLAAIVALFLVEFLVFPHYFTVPVSVIVGLYLLFWQIAVGTILYAKLDFQYGVFSLPSFLMDKA